eukprot:4859638-Prymnesium_polylepis.2
MSTGHCACHCSCYIPIPGPPVVSPIAPPVPPHSPPAPQPQSPPVRACNDTAGVFASIADCESVGAECSVALRESSPPVYYIFGGVVAACQATVWRWKEVQAASPCSHLPFNPNATNEVVISELCPATCADAG